MATWEEKRRDFISGKAKAKAKAADRRKPERIGLRIMRRCVRFVVWHFLSESRRRMVMAEFDRLCWILEGK